MAREKPRQAEIKFLDAFPEDYKCGETHIKGTLYGCRDWPKNTNRATVKNLFEMGLIEHSYIEFYSCPMRLTEKGKLLLSKSKQKEGI